MTGPLGNAFVKMQKYSPCERKEKPTILFGKDYYEMNNGKVIMKVISPANKYKDANTYHDIVQYCTRQSKCKSGYIVKVNLDSYNIANEMEQHAEAKKKNSGTRIRHIVLSTQGENATPETVYDLAIAACEHYSDNYQVFAAVHEDTNNPHCHVILNMVGLDGQRYKGRKKDYYSFQNHMRKAARKHSMKFYVE